MTGRGALVLCALLAATATAAADPFELKLAFFSSDRSATFQAGLQPFIEAVNAEAKGLIHIRLYPSGALGKEIPAQPRLVLDGGADLAFIVPGYTPQLFPDNSVVELPGLFRNGREATLVYNRLIAEKALMGYREFVVIGAYTTEPEAIHSRVPIASLADLLGKRIRVSNAGEAAALKRLGAIPVLVPITEVAGAMSSGRIDAAVISLTPLMDFGISRVATHHYLLGISGPTLALVMNHKVFDGLPPDAQAIIQKYSGTWTAERFIQGYDASGRRVLDQLKSDPKRTVTFPSAADLRQADVAFKAARDDLVNGNPHAQSLVRAVENEIANLREPE
jgi:TRAP-type C4-dicarboxylate transport system substrate-binding protein